VTLSCFLSLCSWYTRVHERFLWNGPGANQSNERYTCNFKRRNLWSQLSSYRLPSAPFRGKRQTLVNKARLESGAHVGLLF